MKVLLPDKRFGIAKMEDPTSLHVLAKEGVVKTLQAALEANRDPKFVCL